MSAVFEINLILLKFKRMRTHTLFFCLSETWLERISGTLCFFLIVISFSAAIGVEKPQRGGGLLTLVLRAYKASPLGVKLQYRGF